MRPLAEVVKAITHQNIDVHITVIVGRNKSLYDALLSTKLPKSLQVKGFVDDMEVWMRAADILVTKAGPNTLSEAFISGLPIVLYTAVPGQEEGNITHVVNNGAGLWAPQPKVAARAVEHLLSHPKVCEKMAARSRALALPYASKDIALKLWELVSDPTASETDIPSHSMHHYQVNQRFTHFKKS